MTILPIAPEHAEQAARIQRIARVLWVSFIVSMLVMPLIVRLTLEPASLLDGRGENAIAVFLPILPVLFAVESVLVAGLALWLPGRLRSAALRSARGGVPGLLQAWLTSWILGWALAESIGINGIVLLVLGYGWSPWAFLVASFLLLLRMAPREAVLADYLEQARRQRPELFTG